MQEKEFGNLSEFSGREVELYRSTDLNNTALYFTKVEDDKRATAQAFFELLIFGLDGGCHQVYLRYPDTDYFVEIEGGGNGSGRGNMRTSEGMNVWKSKYQAPIGVFRDDNNVLLTFSKWPVELNFMSKIAQYNKGNKYNSRPIVVQENMEAIEQALSMKYLKLPEHVRKIAYCLKTTEEKPVYFVVDYPAYNFQYSNHRFRKIRIQKDGITDMPITNFARFRDGGTTIIKVIDASGQEHVLYCPSPFAKVSGSAEVDFKWDETILIEASKQEEAELITMLGLVMEEPDEDSNDAAVKKQS